MVGKRTHQKTGDCGATVVATDGDDPIAAEVDGAGHFARHATLSASLLPGEFAGFRVVVQDVL